MEIILAIETATKVCSVAVVDENKILGEVSLFTPQVHAERLVIIVNNLLSDLKLSYDDLAAVAVSNGPGSFTGLRIGMSVGKGIAFGLDRKLIAVPTLDAIALNVCYYLDSGKLIVPILHARANEFYYSTYQFEGSGLKMKGEYKVAEADEIAAEVPTASFFVGEGIPEFSKYEAVKNKFDSGQMKNIAASAKEIGLIAIEKFKRGEFSDLKSSVPMYIKDFVAVKGKTFNKLLEKI